MKLLCLNLWGGRRGKELFDYLKQQSETADIFCFQEVFDSTASVADVNGARPHLFEELKSLLPEFNGYFTPSYQGWIDMQKVDFPVATGQAVFLKKSIEALEHQSAYNYGKAETEILPDFTNEPKNLQFLKLKIRDKELLVVNAHGKWHPGDKLDTPERLEQSQKILEAVKPFNCPKIICGDFNLMPETQSIKLLEAGFRNLIKEFNIKSTRNKISWEEHRNLQYFADYTFVSSDVSVKSFRVTENEVSDHLPMILEFKL